MRSRGRRMIHETNPRAVEVCQGPVSPKGRASPRLAAPFIPGYLFRGAVEQESRAQADSGSDRLDSD